MSHEELQAAAESAAKKYGAVGLQAAVIENGAVTDSFAWGWADPPIPIPPSPSALS